MTLPTTITIDGPAGAGKSTIGALLAERLGYLYFDTGVMYRALTWAALQRGVDLHDGAALTTLAQQLAIAVQSATSAMHTDGRQYTVEADGEDVTWAIREADVDCNVSQVSSYPGVRAELIRQQRVIGQRGCVVMVGRDIGTIVMPDAPLKIYLEASLDERARRRHKDLGARGDAAPLDDVRAAVGRRDALDSHVMAAANDALMLHTDMMSPAEVVDWIVAQMDDSGR